MKNLIKPIKNRRTYYEIIGVDKYKDDGLAIRKAFIEKIARQDSAQILIAYVVLSDQKQRLNYDKALKESSSIAQANQGSFKRIVANFLKNDVNKLHLQEHKDKFIITAKTSTENALRFILLLKLLLKEKQCEHIISLNFTTPKIEITNNESNKIIIASFFSKLKKFHERFTSLTKYQNNPEELANNIIYLISINDNFMSANVFYHKLLETLGNNTLAKEENLTAIKSALESNWLPTPYFSIANFLYIKLISLDKKTLIEKPLKQNKQPIVNNESNIDKSNIDKKSLKKLENLAHGIVISIIGGKLKNIDNLYHNLYNMLGDNLLHDITIAYFDKALTRVNLIESTEEKKQLADQLVDKLRQGRNKKLNKIEEKLPLSKTNQSNIQPQSTTKQASKKELRQDSNFLLRKAESFFATIKRIINNVIERIKDFFAIKPATKNFMPPIAKENTIPLLRQVEKPIQQSSQKFVDKLNQERTQHSSARAISG